MSLREQLHDFHGLFMPVIDASLLTVLLHIDNKYASIPLAYIISMKDEYEVPSVLLQKITYFEHN